jgi:2-succinyl-5-enolpyruvyl-6-hydroxy-3-cyclohexene-1-carboxylate synthase
VNNLELAQAILSELWFYGVQEVILCAGARNAPFVHVLSGDSPFQVHSFFEERSAGFFAIGRMQATMKPVAVVTTSGTATAELLPACIEADYQRLPLVMMTADRPRRYRGSGAPQTINQTGIYSHYVEASWDVEGLWSSRIHTRATRPIHLNVCFDEPLIDGEIQAWKTGAQRTFTLEPRPAQVRLNGIREPLIVAGGMSSEEAWMAAPILAQWGRPVYAEGPSRLRGHSLLKDLQIQGTEKSFRHMHFDSVIRLGNVPTTRFWRDLENSNLPVHCFANAPFSGLPRSRGVNPFCDLQSIENAFEKWSPVERERDLELAGKRDRLLEQFPLSEPAWFQFLSRQIPADSRLFIGNSLPIREWDFAAEPGSTSDVYANRGTNGIDGLVSTFAGVADEKKSNWAILGDLSALYDLSGPWALRSRELPDFNLVLINNGGGQIFNRLFGNPKFLNAHELHFENWAKMWNLDYRLLREPSDIQPGKQVIEILPDAEQTAAFWKEWEKP